MEIERSCLDCKNAEFDGSDTTDGVCWAPLPLWADRADLNEDFGKLDKERPYINCPAWEWEKEVEDGS